MGLFFIDFTLFLTYNIDRKKKGTMAMKRIRLKSVFTKFVLTFMAVILLLAIILGFSITTIVRNYTNEETQKELSDTSLLFKTTVLGMSGEYDTLENKLRANEEQLRENLSVALFAKPDCGIIILDNTGNIAFFAFKDSKTSNLEIKYGKNALFDGGIIEKPTLSERNMWDIYEVRKAATESDLDNFFKKPVNLYITAISNVEEANFKLNENETNVNTDSDVIQEVPILGENEIGVVISFSGAQGQPGVAQKMSVAIAIIVIATSALALIAIYGVSYSVTKPLREISNAAKDFSKGKYDTRVPVRGNDEFTELAKSFNNLAEKVQAREEMQNSFLSSASHDLRTPMTTIAGFIDGILDGAIPENKQEYYLNIIKNEIKRLSRLVSSLLDISRLQSKDRRFVMKAFNICELVRQTIISFENKLEEKKLDVDFNCDDFDMMALGDKDAINQVIYNLCHNAIKFSYDGGKYRVSINYEDDKIRFTIYNEGVGISKEELPFVFDRFYKSDKSRGLDKTGAGLGLFIAKTIIEGHDGEIGVDSQYEKYCSFYFTLKRV